MVLLKKLICSQKENILKVLAWIFSIVAVILSIVILSIYLQKATNLRTWKNETDVYVKIPSFMNTTTFQKFLKFLNENASNNDKNVDKNIDNHIDNNIDNSFDNSFVNSIDNSFDNSIDNYIANNIDKNIDNSIDNNINNNTYNNIDNNNKIFPEKVAHRFSKDGWMELESENSEPSTPISEDENEIDSDKVNKKECKPLPPKDDFAKCGNRVAERKCCEYIWAWKYKDDLIDRTSCLSKYGVVGGWKAEAGEFPHMVALGFRRLIVRKRQSRYDYFCGGSLISERFVLTAAHCTRLGDERKKEYNVEPEVVAMGSENIKQTQLVKIRDKILHPHYKSPKTYYDIALLKLHDDVDFTYRIHPACLSTELDPQYTKVNVTGWGTTNVYETNKMTDHLQVATVSLMNFKECKPLIKSLHNRNFKGLKSHQLCAGNLNGPVDSCQGDSGGPLQVRINTEYGKIHRVIGVTSFGKRCAIKLPSVYVRVASVISWIEKNVWPELI